MISDRRVELTVSTVSAPRVALFEERPLIAYVLFGRFADDPRERHFFCLSQSLQFLMHGCRQAHCQSRAFLICPATLVMRGHARSPVLTTVHHIGERAEVYLGVERPGRSIALCPQLGNENTATFQGGGVLPIAPTQPFGWSLTRTR